MTERLDTKLTIVENRPAKDIKNEATKRQELADKVEHQMDHHMDRVKKLDVQGRATGPAT